MTGCAITCLAGVARAQIPPPPTGQGTASPPSEEAAERPGRYRLGPFYLTPKFNFGPIGLDTNVLYTSTDRQADVAVQLGPGLDTVVLLGRTGRFYARGNLDYLYFVRTESQRRLVGGALGGLSLLGTKTRLVVEEGFTEAFSRPNYQVDERVAQTTEGTRADLQRRLLSRLGIGALGSRRKTVTESTEPYLGTDLSQVLTIDEYLAQGELSLALTPKTSLVGLGASQWTRYPRDPLRDSDRQLLAGGLRTDGTALVAGRALFGVRYYQLTAPGATRQATFYADVDATLNLSARTKIGASYSRDIVDSIFDPVEPGGTPTVSLESVGARLVKALTSRLDLRLFARKSHSLTDGAISVDIPEQGPVVAVRDDRIREAGADLGYRFRPNFRFAIVATYSDRDSSISYFGVDGLLVGFNAQFNPD